MTNGIGNPDWQRRYTFSAVALQTGSDIDTNSPVYSTFDANGYEYLMLIFDMNTTTAYVHVSVFWSQDAASQQVLGNTNYVLGPGMTLAQRVPVVGRYVQIGVYNVGGGNGQQISFAVYGTNGGYGTMLEQPTAQPMLQKNINIPAGITRTDNATGMFGGRVNVCVNNESNNKWVASMKYYDLAAKNWLLFWAARGSDKGQSYNEAVNLPYAPVQMSMHNLDTVTQSFDYAIIGP